MTITRVNKLGTTNNTGSGLSSLTLTVAATTTAQNTVIVDAGWGAADRTTTVTDSQGNSYTQVASGTVASVFGHVFVARAANPLTAGVDTITITWSGGTVSDALMAAYEYAGLANFYPLDQVAIGTGTSTAPNSGNLTSLYADELLHTFIVYGTNGAVTGHAHTELDKLNGSSHSIETQEQIVSATGTYTGSATLQPTPSWICFLIGLATVPTWRADPVNTTAPVITGSGCLGTQLTCSQGAWSASPAPTGYAYQWKRDGVDIATGAHYLVTTADIGHTLSAEVVASNAFGSTTQAASNTVTPALAAQRAGML